VVPIIKIIEMEYWNMTSIFLNHDDFIPSFNFPFKTLTGLKAERKKAG
jgi:hypothetical protein